LVERKKGKKKKGKKRTIGVYWSKIDVTKIAQYCEEYYGRFRDYPSIRLIFYRFVDELWPNTKGVYKRLSVWLRDKRLDGSIDWQIIRDGSGREYDSGDWSYSAPRDFVMMWLNLFRQMSSKYALPMWTNQPKLVCVVCEKEADYPAIKAIIDDLNADRAYVRGYSGWRMFFELREEILESGKKPVILALSDFDPSGGAKVDEKGKDLTSFLLKALKKLGIDAEVEKVAVTKEQIEKFNLPHRPEDVGEIEKLRKDPRFKTWPYGLYRVETAALDAKAPDYFVQVIREAVLKHFDKDTYEPVKKIENVRRDRIEEFLVEHEDFFDEIRKEIREDDRLEEE